jgi:hypothetical protein
VVVSLQLSEKVIDMSYVTPPRSRVGPQRTPA